MCAEVAAAAVDAKMTDLEKETLQLMQTKDAKRCPNCQLVIEKDGGCLSMFCPGCKTNFNWNGAVSAVLGTKKPLPIVAGMEYWQTPGMFVCEAERGEDEGPVTSNGMLYHHTWDCFMAHDNLYPPMALPDEDDADL
ncbi:hypothetical protein OPT61_g2365 [Boeremia exigua]|uniref:Uncharacterized protein n=1 Tax=Boeremia exigua TaxID=749465 RepID=A0ACC2ILY4_9PLEO|nr:hypothetical protein OPT61_g2365 [Boeremia exigua]